jgi:hypothetical protein
MRKLLFAIVGLVALVASSVAVAHGIEGANTASAVSGTFSAAAGTVNSRSCTTSDGKSVTVTSGTYTGTASGDAALSGAITLRVQSTVNTTDNVGVVSGTFKIGTAARGAFSTVYDGGQVAGLATGQGGKTALLGNVSATFSPTGGFTNGKIGGGTAGGAAVEHRAQSGDRHDRRGLEQLDHCRRADVLGRLGPGDHRRELQGRRRGADPVHARKRLLDADADEDRRAQGAAALRLARKAQAVGERFGAAG